MALENEQARLAAGNRPQVGHGIDDPYEDGGRTMRCLFHGILHCVWRNCRQLTVRRESSTILPIWLTTNLLQVKANASFRSSKPSTECSTVSRGWCGIVM